MMRELVLKMSMSLDGFVAGGAAGSDWMLRASTPESAAWVRETMAGAGTHLVGRRTFESWITYWPTSESPMAAPLNDIPKVVAARRPSFDLAALSAHLPATSDPASWANSRVASGDLVDEVERLKQEDGAYILAQGGTVFCRSLVEAGLVDEYRFAVAPVAIGSGDGLFSGLDRELDLDLVSATALTGGALGLVYRRRSR